MPKKAARKFNKNLVSFLIILLSFVLVFIITSGLLDQYFCFGSKCASKANFDVAELYGLSIDPNNRIGVTGQPKMSELNELKVSWVRIEFIENPVINYKAYIDELHRNNKRVLMIIDYRTISSVSKPHSKSTPAGDARWQSYRRVFIERLKPIASEYRDLVDAWEIWNEPDLFLDGSYDPGIPASEYARFLKESRDVLKNAGVRGELIVGGLASGNENYLKDTIKALGGNLGYDGIGVHPYGQRPSTFPPTWGFSYIKDYLSKYYAAGGNKPLWITEVGTDDRAKAASYLAAFYSDIQKYHLDKVKHVFWFCYSDSMVTPYGLLQSNGVKKDVYSAYKNVVNNQAFYPSVIYDPPENSTFKSTTATFRWAYDAGSIEKYRFTVMNATKNSTIYTTELSPGTRSLRVTGLPSDGSKLVTTLESFHESSPVSVVQTFNAFKTTQLPDVSKPEIIIRARGTSAFNFGPMMKIYINGSLVATEANLTNANYKDFTYRPTVDGMVDTVDIEFTNDAWQNAQNDRNLYVDYIKINGVLTQAEDKSRVKYDRGNGFDSIDIIDAREDMLWSGSLRFSLLQTAPSPPQPPSTTVNSSTLIINAQGIYSNKPPIVKVVTERNSTKTYRGYFEIIEQKDYQFTIPTRLTSGDKVYLYFCNDTSDGGSCSTIAGSQNRDLIFNYLKIDGVKIVLKSPIELPNGQKGVLSDIHYDRANKEDGSKYDNGTIRDVTSANGDFGTYSDGKAVFYGGEKYHWGPVFTGFMPFNGAIVARVNW